MVDLHYVTLPNGFLKEENRNGILVPASLKEAWAIQLDMLELIRIICEKHNIKYYADGGTLLGAVREKGYIPWDNDVDILMDMSNYQKFIEVCKTELKYPFNIWTKEIDKTYSGGHTLLVREDTCIYVNQRPRRSYPLFVDILPWGVVPDDSYLQKNYILRLSNMKNKRTYNSACEYIKLMNQYKDADFNTIASLSIISGNMNTYDRLIEDKHNYDGKTLYLPFEFIKVPVPEKYEIILNHKYGEDWMIPKKGLGFHNENVGIFDTNNSYKDYQEDLIKHTNYDVTGFENDIKEIRHKIYSSTSFSIKDFDEIQKTKIRISNFDELIKWFRELPDTYKKIVVFDYNKNGYTFRILNSDGIELYRYDVCLSYVDSAYKASEKCLELINSDLNRNAN